MGNMRKPDNVLKLSGSYRKDRHGEVGDKLNVTPDMPDKPGFLSDVAGAEWDRVTAVLEKKGLLTELDRTILAQYCALYGKFAADPEGFQATDHTQLRMQEQELGFTPSARGKIVVSKDKNNTQGFRPSR